MRKAQFEKVIADPANKEYVQELRQDAAIQGVQEYQMYVFGLPRWKRFRFFLNTLLMKKQNGSNKK